MVKATPKPMTEIEGYLEPYKNILILGCGGCTSVCLAGGQKEVYLMETNLALHFRGAHQKKISGITVERQCSGKYVTELADHAEKADSILSLACGAGVQLVAEIYPDKPVFPGLNTVAIGIDLDIGHYEERCRACGECVLAYTAGICPVTQCSKALFNGPCGGTNGNECEVGNGIKCAWHEIYTRLKSQHRLEDILALRPPMEWQNQVKRTVVQTIQRTS